MSAIALLARLDDWTPTCRFGLCRREAEHQVVFVDDDHDAEQVSTVVCGLHVTPVAVWGAPDDAPLPVIVPLSRASAER